jgi:hypothetical protein
LAAVVDCSSAKSVVVPPKASSCTVRQCIF